MVEGPMNVADLMTRDVITVHPENTLREVASLLSTEHIGGAPVIAGGEILGVITATDILEFDADTPGVRTGRHRPAEDAADEVVRGDEAAAAYFSDFWDDAGADVTGRIRDIESPEWSALDEHVASEFMTRAVFSVAPDLPVQEAARRMMDAGVHRALVVEDGRLAGVLSTLDILRAVSQRGIAG